MRLHGGFICRTTLKTMAVILQQNLRTDPPKRRRKEANQSKIKRRHEFIFAVAFINVRNTETKKRCSRPRSKSTLPDHQIHLCGKFKKKTRETFQPWWKNIDG